MIFPPKGEKTPDEDAKSIALQYPHANPLKLDLTATNQHQGWLQKTYKIKDGAFEWTYDMAIESNGKVEIRESRQSMKDHVPSKQIGK
jgi:hypothetical protein